MSERICILFQNSAYKMSLNLKKTEEISSSFTFFRGVERRPFRNFASREFRVCALRAPYTLKQVVISKQQTSAVGTLGATVG